eukprot:1180200-Prorocentrum_minimum.AAC.2
MYPGSPRSTPILVRYHTGGGRRPRQRQGTSETYNARCTNAKKSRYRGTPPKFTLTGIPPLL